MNYNKVIDDAKQFAADNLIECCKELMIWTNTAILPSGKVRELSDMLMKVAGSRSLVVAENIVKTAAFEHIVKENK